jgi:hypothetical protein
MAVPDGLGDLHGGLGDDVRAVLHKVVGEEDSKGLGRLKFVLLREGVDGVLDRIGGEDFGVVPTKVGAFDGALHDHLDAQLYHVMLVGGPLYFDETNAAFSMFVLTEISHGHLTGSIEE